MSSITNTEWKVSVFGKCPYTPHLVRIRENTDQKNSQDSHFLHSVSITNSLPIFSSIINFHNKQILVDIKKTLPNITCNCKDKSLCPLTLIVYNLVLLIPAKQSLQIPEKIFHVPSRHLETLGVKYGVKYVQSYQ